MERPGAVGGDGCPGQFSKAGQPGWMDVLPRSCVGVDGPWLVVAVANNPVVRVDARMLDRIGVVDEELILAVDDLDVTMWIADGTDAARHIVDELAPYTRRGPLATAAAYRDAKRRIGRGGGVYEVTVDEEPLRVTGEHVRVGRVAFRMSEVCEYAEAGANLPLPGGKLLQAAIATLVYAAYRRGHPSDDVALLRRRVAVYEAHR